jgi:hypothetical protein
MLSLVTRRKCVVNFKVRPLYPWERTPVTTEEEAEFAPQSFWTFWRQENHFPPSGIRTAVCPTRNLVTCEKRCQIFWENLVHSRLPFIKYTLQPLLLFHVIDITGLMRRTFYARLNITTYQTNGLYLSNFTFSVNNKWFFTVNLVPQIAQIFFLAVSLPTQYVIILSDCVPLFTPALFWTLFDFLMFAWCMLTWHAELTYSGLVLHYIDTL